VALAGCAPGRAVTFFCFAKRKSPKKRRAGCVVLPLRYRHAALLGQCGKCRNSLRSDICTSFSALACATRLRTRQWGPNTKTKNNKDALWRVLVGFGCSASQCRVAGLSSAAAGGSGRALFERSEFSPTPHDASSARNRAAALTSARLSFGYFALAKQRKVPRPPGRDPACTVSNKSGRKRKGTRRCPF